MCDLVWVHVNGLFTHLQCGSKIVLLLMYVSNVLQAGEKCPNYFHVGRWLQAGNKRGDLTWPGH